MRKCERAAERRNTWTAWLAAAMVLGGPSSVARASAPPVLAVLDVQFRGKPSSTAAVDRTALSNLSELLRTKLVESGAYLVVEKGQQEAALRTIATQIKQDSYASCYDESCQIEIGKALAAAMLVASAIAPVGDGCTFTSRLFDLAREATTTAVSAKIACTESGAVEALDRIVDGLVVPGSGTVLVETTPPGALVKLNGTPQGEAPVQLRRIPRGTHDIELSLGRFASTRRTVNVPSGETVRLAVELEAVEEASPLAWLPWVLGGLSAAAVGTGAYLALMAESEHNAAKFGTAKDPAEAITKGRRFKLGAELSYGTAGALALGAVVGAVFAW